MRLLCKDFGAKWIKTALFPWSVQILARAGNGWLVVAGATVTSPFQERKELDPIARPSCCCAEKYQKGKNSIIFAKSEIA